MNKQGIRKNNILIFSIIIVAIVLIGLGVWLLTKTNKPSETTVTTTPVSDTVNQEDLSAVSEVCRKKYDQNGVTFQYPCTWKVKEEQRTHWKWAWLISPDEEVQIALSLKGLESFENDHKDEIDEGFITVETRVLTLGNTNYTVRYFGQHGGQTTFVPVSDGYLEIYHERVSLENYLDDLSIIVSSFSF